MACVFLSLGSNIDDREAHLRSALESLARLGKVGAVSSLYETEPWGVQDQSWFLNCCAEMETTLSPRALLKECLKIERAAGRERREKYGPRTLDIDILFYGDIILPSEARKTELTQNSGPLQIPHPELQNRRFVLVPLCEIAPRFVHPLLKKTIEELLKECPDGSIVKLAA